MISMMEPKVALMTAPIPMDDWADIDATAIPIKYDRGMTLRRQRKKTSACDAMNARNAGTCWPLCSRFSTIGMRTSPSKMTKKTTGRRLMKRMLTPPTVYL